MKKSDLIPKSRVIDDMYNNSGYAYEAREYYYKHYATPEERLEIDREKKIESVVRTLFGVGAIIMAALIILAHLTYP